jgi:hypothetical protein
MPTKMYLQNVASPVNYASQLNALFSASGGGSAVGLLMGGRRVGNYAEVSTTMTGASGYYRPFYFVSPPLSRAVTIDAADIGGMAMVGNPESKSCVLQFIVRRVVGTTVQSQGLLNTFSSTFPYTKKGEQALIGQGVGLGTNDPIQFNAGDKIIVDMLASSNDNTTFTLKTGYGGTSGDLTAGSTDTTLAGYIQFTQNNILNLLASGFFF